MSTRENTPETDEELIERFSQQWLLAPPKPLTERLGREFFLGLPKGPGVYLMHGHGGLPRRPRILYIGKSKNLRQRLDSYRHVRPDRDSRKTVRLVHSVDRITFEQCADETAALLRENELLREHRPLFNRVNIRPEAHGYIGLRAGSRSLTVKLAAQPDDEFDWHGAFKGSRRYAVAAMLRLLIQREQLISNWSALPRALCRDTAPVQFELPLKRAPQVKRLLERYLRGRSWKIIEQLDAWHQEHPVGEAFLKTWRERDLDSVRTFYLNGPRRNARWRKKLGLSDQEILRPEDLDDLPIKIQLPAEPSPWPEKETDG